MGTVEDLLEQASTSFAEESAKATPQKWKDRFVLFFIKNYGEYKHLFGKPKTNKKKRYSKRLQVHLNADVVVSGEQCTRKWLKLEAKYKEVKDNSKRTGRAKQSWKFHQQIAECIGDIQRVNPAYTFDSEINSYSSSTSCNDDGGKSSEVNSGYDDCDDDDDGECREKRSKTLKNKRRKRKSYSFAAEMLGFLQSYTERKEKAEEKKIKLLLKC